MEIKERLGRIVTLGLFDKITSVKHNPDVLNKYVAAGNPGIVAHTYPHSIHIPEYFFMGGEKCHREDYTHRTVFGNSMLVDGIHSGWELLLKPVENREIKQGDFIVINVDKDYFRHRHNDDEALFQLKLRRAIGKVNSTATVESLAKLMQNTFAEPLDDEDTKDLEDSLNDACTFYNRNEPLFLSATYHESKIHYSFHPIDSIEYLVEGVAFGSDNGVVFKLPEEL